MLAHVFQHGRALIEPGACVEASGVALHVIEKKEAAGREQAVEMLERRERLGQMLEHGHAENRVKLFHERKTERHRRTQRDRPDVRKWSELVRGIMERDRLDITDPGLDI